MEGKNSRFYQKKSRLQPSALLYMDPFYTQLARSESKTRNGQKTAAGKVFLEKCSFEEFEKYIFAISRYLC